MAREDFPESFRDPLYASLDSATEQRLGLPVGMLSAVRTEGEKSNASQTSSASARTPYQIIPATRKAILDQYGIDAYLSPQTASEAAGLLLRDSLKRNDGDPEAAVREYHGGTDRGAWGKQNDAYWQRVSAGMRDTATKSLMRQFGKYLADNPATPEAPAPSKPEPQSALERDFGGWLAGQDQIPGTPVPADRAPASQLPPAPAPQVPGIIDKAIGTGEAALNIGTGLTGGTIGMIGGTLKGLAEQILSGQFGTPQAANLVEQAAAGGAQALTYAPRTESGQDQAQAAGQALQQLIPVAAVAPALVPAGAAAPATAAVADAGRAAAQRVANLGREATTLPRRALAALTGEEPAAPTPTTGTMGSLNAAGTDMAAQRVAAAQSMPVPIELTKGQASRDPAQLKFEVESAKQPELGAPLRKRTVEQNDAILRNFDTWIDSTGAEAPSLRAIGSAVDSSLVKQAARDKLQIRAAYKAAENAGEMEAPVTLGPVVQHLIDNAPEAVTAPVLTVARQKALQLGVAVDDGAGGLVAQPVPLKTAELFRRSIGNAAGFDLTNVRQATILKGLIDEATAGKGGDLYRQARALRARYAQNYEDRAVIAKLLNNKRGTADRQVALEDVLDHAVLRGSLDDVRNVRRVLQRSGSDGEQAWRELQGGTLAWIKDQATKSVATDAAGNRVISAAGIDKAIRELDRDGRLDFVFGKLGAQKLRDLNDLAKYVKTVPPEAGVNTSNTAATLLAAFGDIALSGATGAPAPIMTAARIAVRNIRDAKLRRRISDALDEIRPLQAPGQSAPPRVAPTVH